MTAGMHVFAQSVFSLPVIAGGSAAAAVGSLPGFPDGQEQAWALHKGVLAAVPGADHLLHLCDCLLHQS